MISFGRTGFESFKEDRLLVGRKLGSRTAARPRAQRGHASVAVGIGPTLYKPSTAPQTILNGLRVHPLENQQDDAVSIALLSVPFNPCPSRQRRRIARRNFLNMHA